MTSSTPLVRPARAPETIMLHDLWLAADDAAEWTPAEGPGAPLLAALDVLVADRRLWLALDDERAVGFAGAGEIDSALFITVLGVAGPFRHRGIGRQLLAAIVSFGTAANYPAIYVVALTNSAGHGFLRDNGFVDLDTATASPAVAALVAGAEARERCTVMARPL